MRLPDFPPNQQRAIAKRLARIRRGHSIVPLGEEGIALPVTGPRIAPAPGRGRSDLPEQGRAA